MSGRGSNRTTEDLSPGTDSRLDEGLAAAACAGGNIVNSVLEAAAFT